MKVTVTEEVEVDIREEEVAEEELVCAMPSRKEIAPAALDADSLTMLEVPMENIYAYQLTTQSLNENLDIRITIEHFK